jgi:phage-related protein
MSPTDTPLEFVGSSKDDLSEFPVPVKVCIGFALRAAQKGKKHPDAKPLKGFRGAGVVEIVSDFDGDTFRAVGLRSPRVSEEVEIRDPDP